MTAIGTFNNTISRARSLGRLHGSLTAQQRGRMPDPDDLLRSALVIAVAGMDAYFTDRFSESLVRYLKKHGAKSGLVTFLSGAGLDTKAALDMLSMDRPYRRVRSLVEEHLSHYTTQKQDVIDALFLNYGVKNLSGNAQGMANRKTLLNSVEAAVMRRHSIVHAGDLNAHDNRRKLTVPMTKKYIKDVEQYVKSCEKLLSKALKI